MQDKSRRVLIVDDNVDAADLLLELLKLNGQVTAVAYDGSEGVETAIKFRPDVAVVDLGLPKLNGFEVAARLRQHDATRDTVLIAHSAWTDPDTKGKAMSCGFDLYVAKPANLPQLPSTTQDYMLGANISLTLPPSAT